MAALLFLLALALAFIGWRSRRDERRERFARLVPGWLAGAVAVRALLELFESGAARAWTPLVLAAAALAGLWTWAHLAALSAVRPRRRDWLLRAPFALLVLLLATLGTGGSGVTVGTVAGATDSAALVFFTMLATWSFRWRDALTTRQLFATAVALAAYVALGFLEWAPGASAPHTPPGSASRTMLEFARWASAVSAAHALIAIPPVLGRFVRDPTLGIHTVRWRVALSHALVLLVPLGIVAGLWVLTTYLGVGAERALVARRAIAAEAGGLRLALAQALGAPGSSERALAALAGARSGKWPDLRVWSLERDSVRRVAGGPVAGEASLAGWCAALDSLNDFGVVEIGGRRWLGAAARERGGRAAVALVPIGQALDSSLVAVVGARVEIGETAPRTIEEESRMPADSVALDARGDSLELERVRDMTRRFGLPDSLVRADAPPAEGAGRVRITTAGDTLDLSEGDSPFGTGRAEADGVALGRSGWRNQTFSLGVEVGLRQALAGLYRNTRENQYNVLAIAILGFLVLLLMPVAVFNFVVVRQLGRSVTEPVAGLRRATAALAEGRLDHRVPLRGDDELWETAQAFNRMAEGLEVARAREQERQKLENELEVARRIQARLLPAGPPSAAGLEISGQSESAREVGGDYFDHLVLPDGRVLLVIADVSGKGVPAALLMSAFRASLMSQDASRGDPAEVATHLNDFLHRSVDPGKFVTAFVGFLDGRSGRFVYANAGHNPPALVRADGRVEWLSTGGLILGILSPSAFESGLVTLEPGDLLALYTDGVTEGADASGEQFGEERLVDVLRRRSGESCADLAEHLVREVRSFEGEQGPADDITVLLARRSRA